MPSVRVRRNNGRPYLHIEDSPTTGPLDIPPPSGGSNPPSLHIQPPASPQITATPRRARSRTLASLFGGSIAESVPTTLLETSGRAAQEHRPGDTVASRRRGSILRCPEGGDRQSSVIHNTCRGLPPRSGEDSSRFLSLGRSSSPPAPEQRASLLSVGSGGVNVGMRMSRDDVSGRVGSALSISEDSDDDDGDESGDHHHDDIVEHLDVIDPHVATVTHLSNAANSIIFPPLSIYSRRPVIMLPNVSEDGVDAQNQPYTDELDRHVDHVLRRRDKIRRGLKGLWAYVKTPLGFCTALYGFLCAFWGAAIVIFLAKIINLHNPDLQNFWIEISSQVTNGLFTATGVGLIPWRVIDTYRVLKIWRFKRLTRKRRVQQNLPALQDEDDLPDPVLNEDYVHVLTDEEQDELHYQQQKFSQSQTWYRPHATETHRAFPINAALWICLLIDWNSIFQIMLCGTMWGFNRFDRPAWTTATLIPASFLCAIGAAVIIGRAGTKTKKTKQVEERLRKALQLEQQGLMNAHVELKDDFAVVEINKTPPNGAETMVIPHSKSQTADAEAENEKPDLHAIPSGPASDRNTSRATASRKAPILP